MKLHDGPYIVHVTGSIPHFVRGWSRTYGTEAIARAQIEHLFAYPRTHRAADTDWQATIYVLDGHDLGKLAVVDAALPGVTD